MTAHVLESLERKDAAAFAAACESAWGDISPSTSTAETRPEKATTKSEVRKYRWYKIMEILGPCSMLTLLVSDVCTNGHMHCQGQHGTTVVVSGSSMTDIEYLQLDSIETGIATR